MTDIKSREDRSRNMAAIRSIDTGPEVYLRKRLFSRGIRYRKNVRYVPGHPDIFMRKYNTAVFVNGCFWHRHAGCRFTYMPKSRIDFWNTKFNKNIKRDDRVRRELQEKRIRQLIVWECTVRKMKRNCEYEGQIIDEIMCFIKGDDPYLEL